MSQSLQISLSTVNIPIELSINAYILNGLLFRSRIYIFARVFLVILAVLSFFAVIRFFSNRAEQTEEHLILDRDVIPWQNIDRITLKKSAVGNQYIAVYFKDDTPPKGFDIEFINKKEAFIKYLTDHAEEKGFTFTSALK